LIEAARIETVAGSVSALHRTIAAPYRSLLMDRQLRVTDNLCEQHMRDLELNFLFNLGGHMDSHGNARRKDTLE
jgi:hypothetical protein